MSAPRSDEVQAKLARLGRLRRDGGALRDYQAPRWNEPLIMEQSVPGERGVLVPRPEEEVTAEVGEALKYVPAAMRRATPPDLPEISQHQALRHYLRLSQMTLGMDLGSDISEGTCTMKYSPKVHEELVRYHKHADLHPLQDEATLQGLLQIVYDCGEYLKAISGMAAITLQPGGGSHAVYTNACVMRAYFAARGELGQRDEMITTIFSHPCDAATPAVAGFKVITVMPDENGYPDLEAFKAAVSERTVGCMITNPEDTGIYNPQIDKYVEVLHKAGALAFTDQANANGILGFARARDAGFDACHFNLHKTFSSPHGCEGPATGAYLVGDELAPYPAGAGRRQGRRALPPRLRAARLDRSGARLPGQLDGRAARLRLDPQPRSRRPARGGRDQRPQQQLPRPPAHGRARREPALRRRPPPARPGALQPRDAQGGDRRGHRRRA